MSLYATAHHLAEYMLQDCPTIVEEHIEVREIPYREAVEALLRASTMIRPDIAGAFSQRREILRESRPGTLEDGTEGSGVFPEGS